MIPLRRSAPGCLILVGSIDMYSDTSRFRFSLAQQKVFGGWKRPRDALSRYRADSSNGPPLEPTMVATASIDLVQDITTDCSVVASLCALVARGHEGLQQVGAVPNVLANPKC